MVILPPDVEAIGKTVVNSALKVHRRLGPGLLEKLYEACLFYELTQCGLVVARQVTIPIVYEGIAFDEGLRIDLLVDKQVIVEVKSVELVNPVWQAQVLSQLKMTGHHLGYLINFNVPLIKDGIKGIVV
jgi:GxxExxY protein